MSKGPITINRFSLGRIGKGLLVVCVAGISVVLIGYVSILLAGLNHFPDQEVASRFLGKREDCLLEALGPPDFEIKKLASGQLSAEFPIPTYERPRSVLNHRVMIYCQRAALLYVFVNSKGLIESVEICKT